MGYFLPPHTMSIAIRYFPCRGRVEPLRLLFAEAGVAWKEDPLTDFASWPAEKAATPFGSLPIVTDGDKKYTQSMAIIRHYANQTNLAAKYYWNKDWENDKKEAESTILPPIYTGLQNFFKEGNDGPFVLGEQFSVADCVLWCFLDCMRPFVPEALPQYKELNQFFSDFSSREKINAYLHSDRRFK